MRSWLGVSKWVDDAAPFPGEIFRRWVGDFYQRDKLVKGEMELRGHRVDLSNIRCAVLNVSGKWDYTVSPSQTEATTALASSPDRGVRLSGRRARGHARRAGGRGQPLAPRPGLARAPLRLTARANRMEMSG